MLGFQHNLDSINDQTCLMSLATERWLSGRKRRFAKSVNGSNRSAGSNPVRSAFS